ncbi:hypothetical protein, partial [Bradyrhizobium uaiense]
HGNLSPVYIFYVTGPLILFEIWVHGAITWYMRKDRDLPVIRREQIHQQADGAEHDGGADQHLDAQQLGGHHLAHQGMVEIGG